MIDKIDNKRLKNSSRVHVDNEIERLNISNAMCPNESFTY